MFTPGTLLALAALVVIAPTGCSSGDDEPGTETPDAGGHDPATNCIAPGTPSNDRGVGGYCTTGDECPKSFCSALFGAPEDAWFCTVPCKKDADCGEGAACMTDPRGVACVPFVCGGIPSADAGADGGAR
jgi:hypothetical protein